MMYALSLALAFIAVVLGISLFVWVFGAFVTRKHRREATRYLSEHPEVEAYGDVPFIRSRMWGPDEPRT